MKFRIYRYDPESGAKPRMQDYQIEFDPAGKKVLDVLIAIKETQDESLSFRRSCREGVCGSDGLNINGVNRLACITALEDLKQPIEIRPLPRLAVIRDLIVDMGQFYQHYKAVKPYLINLDPEPESEHLQSPEDRGRTRWPVRMHPVRMLYHLLPVVLVEPGQVPRPCSPAAGLPLHRRYPRPGDRRAARLSGRSLSAVSLPRHHELRRGLSQGPEPDPGHRQDQDAPGKAFALSAELNRLRWRCQRGMLELDHILGGFLENDYLAASAENKHAFESLLAMEDADILDLIMGRAQPSSLQQADLLTRLRR